MMFKKNFLDVSNDHGNDDLWPFSFDTFATAFATALASFRWAVRLQGAPEEFGRSDFGPRRLTCRS